MVLPNYWTGNYFNIPPLPQYTPPTFSGLLGSTPSPTSRQASYQPLYTPDAVSGDSLGDQLGFGAPDQEGTWDNIGRAGLNTLGFAMGPATASMALAAQIGMLGQNPSTFGTMSLARGIGEELGLVDPAYVEFGNEFGGMPGGFEGFGTAADFGAAVDDEQAGVGEGFDSAADFGEAVDDEQAADESEGDDAGDDSVICNELYRMGYMPRHIWAADQRFARDVPDEVIAGYHWWAKPAVRWMRRSKFAVRLARMIALPWARHMAYRMGASDRNDLFGAAIMLVGWPVCRLIGTMAAGSTAERSVSPR